jgi:addiction module RelE/StbE family toxin
MYIIFSKTFVKAYKKANGNIKNSFEEKLELFKINEFDARLNNHSLNGEYSHVRSISVTGDWRAHYEIPKKDIRYFIALGTHSELYKK